LNAHSLFHDTEMNVVTLDERVARAARVRLWSEHLELAPEEIEDVDPIELIDKHWQVVSSEQLELLENGEALTHRLVKLPGVSRRRRRLIGGLQSHLYDV
jgi:phosphatidylserine/phosphatidylglycerophosphate/cardiolipin synthase-like enzyme